MISLVPALALMFSASTEPETPRHFLGESAFSFEVKGDLKQVRSESISGGNDWLAKVTDWEVDGKDIYLAARMLEGKPGTKMDKAFLKEAVDDFVDGLESEEDEARQISNEVVAIDDQLAHKASYRVERGKEFMYIQLVFLTAGTNLYSLFTVYFEESGKSADAAKKAIDSVRFKRPLD